MGRADGTSCMIKDCKTSSIQYVFIQHFDGVCVQMLLSINLDSSQAEKIPTDNKSWHTSNKSYTLGISNKRILNDLNQAFSEFNSSRDTSIVYLSTYTMSLVRVIVAVFGIFVKNRECRTCSVFFQGD